MTQILDFGNVPLDTATGALGGYIGNRTVKFILGGKGYTWFGVGKTPVSDGFSVINPSPKTAVPVSDNPLANKAYTQKVLDQMNLDVYHGFPSAIDSYGNIGRKSTLIGNDGIARTKIEISGSINGKNGVYEYIIEPDNKINHRFFKLLY